MAAEVDARILVVDDNRVNRLVLEKRLAREGYEVRAATGGGEALRFLGLDGEEKPGGEAEEFDAVVLDIMMPEIDGLEVLRRIRKTRSANGLPVIMATAKDQTEDIVEALALGSNDYVTKPINMPILLARLRTQVSLRKTHHALKEAQHSLVEAAKMESVGYLAAGVAHEVRNPLAQIQMGVEAIGQSDAVTSDETLAPVIEIIQKGVLKADAIIRELMRISTTGQLKLEQKSVNDLIRDVLESAGPEIDAAGIALKTELDESAPLVPLAAAEMSSVLSNVISNAIEAMPKGGELKVRTARSVIEGVKPDEGSRSGRRIRTGNEAVSIEITDTGTGIPQEKLHAVFDPFFTTKATGQGTGLGLSLARKIIQLHHGLITVKNRDKEPGVRVVIHLRTTFPLEKMV